ncbi:MAG: phage antirepressor protein [Acidobacteriota bacterium]|nr:phage antirepressor protein [Acidobacteriota bacterium]
MSDNPPGPSKFLPKDISFEEIKKRAAPDMGPLGKDEGSSEPVEQGESQLVLFEGITVRKIFHENEWHFSIVDIIAALTGNDRPSKYWSDLKSKLVTNEGFSELSDFIGQLKMQAADGKFYLTDSVTVEIALRIIQSIPSPKAEPFRRWLAKVGYERIQEIQDPEIAVKRAILMWQAQGRTSDWIEARLRCIVARRELTDQWQRGGISGAEYGRLTNIISKETFDLDTGQHKQLKGLTKQNLRDHMTDLELVFTMLGEKSTTAIAQAMNAQGLHQNVNAAKSGGRVAGDARRNLERQLNGSVVSRTNFLEGTRKKDPEKLTQKTRLK